MGIRGNGVSWEVVLTVIGGSLQWRSDGYSSVDFAALCVKLIKLSKGR